MKNRALIVLTSHDQLGSTNEKTGWYLSEVSHVYYPLIEGGFSVDFASPKGGIAPLDKTSLKEDNPENRKFIEEYDIKSGIATQSLNSVDPEDYQVVFFAGGHGTMWDFPDNEDIQLLTPIIYENGGIVAAVCHGPSALLNVKLSNEKYLVEGKEVSSFTNAEEIEIGKEEVMPFLLESKFRERGAFFRVGKNWENKVVVSERLITGQNPQSAAALGKMIVETFNNLKSDKSQRDASKEGSQDMGLI